ncbi:hypothetical protein COO60DRAFT_1202543 [Scenedesmus sp. NREL 46B-D3]|nr:hypothetical protein COO60DRAFT_1202543 [Scenedesmus sp. NREL 46B-D3]
MLGLARLSHTNRAEGFLKPTTNQTHAHTCECRRPGCSGCDVCKPNHAALGVIGATRQHFCQRYMPHGDKHFMHVQALQNYALSMYGLLCCIAPPPPQHADCSASRVQRTRHSTCLPAAGSASRVQQTCNNKPATLVTTCANNHLACKLRPTEFMQHQSAQSDAQHKTCTPSLSCNWGCNSSLITTCLATMYEMGGVTLL